MTAVMDPPFEFDGDRSAVHSSNACFQHHDSPPVPARSVIWNDDTVRNATDAANWRLVLPSAGSGEGTSQFSIKQRENLAQ